MDHLENKRQKPFTCINGDAHTLDWMMLSTFNMKLNLYSFIFISFSSAVRFES